METLLHMHGGKTIVCKVLYIMLQIITLLITDTSLSTFMSI